MKTVGDTHRDDVSNVLRPSFAQIKVQSVRIHNVRAIESNHAQTIGQAIDHYLQQEIQEGRHPSKVSVDLCPKYDNPAEMD